MYILFNEHYIFCVDPVGELRLAKQRIYELEKSEVLQRDEVCCRFASVSFIMIRDANLLTVL